MPFRDTAEGATLAVRLTPKGGRDAVEGMVTDAAGRRQLKVRVSAVPEDGKANAALIALLSKVWKIPKSRIALIGGATDRNKVVRIAGASASDLANLLKRDA